MPALKKGILSSLLLVTDSIFKKSVGLISTLILARVLLPEDFGIVAIATLVLGFFSVLAQTGTNQYIVRSENPDKGLLNTAFSLNFIIRLVLSFFLFTCSYPIAEFYDDERLLLLLYVFSLLLLIEGLSNPAVNLLKRRQEYKKIVKLTIIVKFISASSAIFIALIYESYWALAIGHFLSVSLTTIGGYYVYPFLPKWSLKNIQKQLHFSGWLIPQSLLGYCRTQFDTFIISDKFGQDKLGSYHTMKYLAYIPSNELLLPATEPLLAQLAPLRGNQNYFSIRYTIANVITMVIALPVAIFLFFYSFEITLILLGNNWIEHHEIFAWFALIVPAYAMYHNANRTLIIFAKTKITLFYEILCALIIISVLLILTFDSMLALVQIKTLLELILSGAYFCYASIKYCNFRYTLICIALIALIAFVSIVLLSVITNTIEFESLFIEVFVAGLFFVVMYSIFWLGFIYSTKNRLFISEYLFSLLVKSLHNK